MLEKSEIRDGQRLVTFVLPAEIHASQINLCGEFNGWSTSSLPMERDRTGAFSVTVTLAADRSYRYRYLIDGVRWENDWVADDYVPNEFGGEDSLVNS